jgi:hypothetical protein
VKETHVSHLVKFSLLLSDFNQTLKVTNLNKAPKHQISWRPDQRFSGGFMGRRSDGLSEFNGRSAGL